MSSSGYKRSYGFLHASKNNGYSKRQKASLSANVRPVRVSKQVALRAQVRKIVTNMAEKKTVRYQAPKFLGGYNNSNFATNQIIPLSPYSTFCQIDQGVSQDERIGNKIKITKSALKLQFWALPYNATTNLEPCPMLVRVCICSAKDDSNTLSGTLSNFFQNGSGSNPPTSGMEDMVAEINRDAYTVYKDMVVKVGYSGNTGTGSDVGQAYFSNNDFPLCPAVSVDTTRFNPATVQFNDNLSIPNSKLVFLTYFAARADGTGTAATNQTTAVYINNTLFYTDD